MIQARNLGLLLALLSVVMLPACSMFGGDNAGSRSMSTSSQTSAPPPPSYSQQQQSMSQQPLTPDTVRQVQQTLRQNGMYRGRVDGIWGPATQAAVRSYQQQNNLNASGQLDPQTLASLNLGNDQNGQNYGNNSQPPNYQANANNAQPNNAPPMNQPASQQNAQSNGQSNTTTR